MCPALFFLAQRTRGERGRGDVTTEAIRKGTTEGESGRATSEAIRQDPTASERKTNRRKHLRLGNNLR